MEKERSVLPHQGKGRGWEVSSEWILAKTEAGDSAVYLPTASPTQGLYGNLFATCRETTKPVLVDGLEQDV
jgi:hypothetical protein